MRSARAGARVVAGRHAGGSCIAGGRTLRRDRSTLRAPAVSRTRSDATPASAETAASMSMLASDPVTRVPVEAQQPAVQAGHREGCVQGIQQSMKPEISAVVRLLPAQPHAKHQASELRYACKDGVSLGTARSKRGADSRGYTALSGTKARAAVTEHSIHAWGGAAARCDACCICPAASLQLGRRQAW